MQSEPDPVAPLAAEFSKQIGEHKYYGLSRRLIMNGDLNATGRLFGGKLMAWVDEAAALFCMAQMGTRRIVTKKISEVIFNEPADLGDVLEFFFRVKHGGRTSLTVECRVITKVIGATERKKQIVECDLVFVSIGTNGKPEPHLYSEERVNSPDFEF